MNVPKEYPHPYKVRTVDYLVRMKLHKASCVDLSKRDGDGDGITLLE